MTLIFDTSIIIDLENVTQATVKNLSELKNLYPEQAKISFITYYEFINGLRNKQQHNKEKSRMFIENFEVISTTKLTAHILSTLKEKYGDLDFSDLFIAAQAIENNMILVTKDKDFERIEELDKIIIES